ncbi:hypothetical protein CERZMDRAFT_102041 [Cercospora zeae-maydis SCOH1-5]|uniref:Protein kinase domain-containing protein n=1 Tax=Cercospora zeae-maydis SCOH1-5 TaxID=717836 RepID=A0A6A6F227_9PEZI|nr:hypothetical protein CERZMDRAFT_102041 [Cercospora zeae-maydis SCOH1-5]
MTSSKVTTTSLPTEQFVYKGFTFYHFLIHGEEGFRFEVVASHREIEMVNHIIPRHRNVMPPARALMYVALPKQDREGLGRLICGSLYEWSPGRSLADLLDQSPQTGKGFPSSLKAKWCLQLCEAMTHVHTAAHNWHQVLKPPNVLLDSEQNIIVVDWEQCGATPFVLAPEAAGTLDVRKSSEEISSGRPRLIHSKYAGPRRRNQESSPIGRSSPVRVKAIH